MGNLKVAFLFPGQGSQTVGMGRELADRFPEAREAFREADDAFGGGLSQLCWNGPEEELQRTAVTQPAIVGTSAAALAVMTQRGITPDFVAGHSVGEYAALIAAGVLGLADAVRLTKLRGELMEAACPQGTGSMAAIVGMGEEQVRSICQEAAGGLVAEVAALNCPGQVVVAGHLQALSEVLSLAKAGGAVSATMLRVSGPFHSSLMAPAESGLGGRLRELAFAPARVPVVSNTDAQAHTGAAKLQANLIGQLTKPVLWQKTVELLIGLGVRVFVELGAGRVLSGMLRRTSKEAQLLNVGDAASLEKTLGWFRSEGLAASAPV